MTIRMKAFDRIVNVEVVPISYLFVNGFVFRHWLSQKGLNHRLTIGQNMKLIVDHT